MRCLGVRERKRERERETREREREKKERGRERNTERKRVFQGIYLNTIIIMSAMTISDTKREVRRSSQIGYNRKQCLAS